jgi:ParB family chromosome partitioning protein
MDADGTIHPHYLTVQAAATTDALARLADDPTQPATVRDHAARELTLLDHGQPSAELVKAAQAAIARATNAPSTNQADNSEKPSADLPQPTPMKRYGLRAFLSTIEEMDGWWQHYDSAEIASGLSDTQWQQVRANLDGSIAFIDDIAAARDTAAQTKPVHGERAADQPPHAACF